MWNAQKTFKIDLRRALDMHPKEIVEAIDKLQGRLKVIPGDDTFSVEAQNNATLFFNIFLRNTLASKRVLDEYWLTRESFGWVINHIELCFRQSLVEPGKMVELAAAQSISKSSTCMELSTFHSTRAIKVSRVLGIEAACRHLAILCDVMTWSGFVRPIGKEDKRRPPLVRLSVENTIDNVIHATAYTETDYIRGVRESTMLRKLAPTPRLQTEHQ
ncbi:hypothetical protein ACFX1Z_026750 [Malus domestica]